ncbi:MAG TPA: hypothetical protein DSN98_06340 [Thermoplasmata archaeon]|nr:MAG TPA: hypothetical protein DSN98_06340 [Thermoplasmata archaeon]
MKRQIRILGIDDAPFNFDEKYSAAIGVVMRGGEYLECVLRSCVTIDGTDATAICTQMIKNSRHRHQLKAVMLDGACLGGFNVVDIDELSESTSLPVITITRDKPDMQKIKQALSKNFNDWKDRWAVLQKGKLHRIPTQYNPIYIKCSGLSLEEAKEIINISTIRGVIPEPIRVAHLIASGITRGESYGKA